MRTKERIKKEEEMTEEDEEYLVPAYEDSDEIIEEILA